MATATATKAEVTLSHSGPLTHTGNGRTMTRGEKIIVTKPSDIIYYQRQGVFTVEFKDGGAKGRRGARADAEFDGDLEEEKPRKSARATIEKESEPNLDEPVDGDLTEDELNGQTKASLIELIETEGLKIDGYQTMNKADLVSSILGVQKKKAKK